MNTFETKDLTKQQADAFEAWFDTEIGTDIERFESKHPGMFYFVCHELETNGEVMRCTTAETVISHINPDGISPVMQTALALLRAIIKLTEGREDNLGLLDPTEAGTFQKVQDILKDKPEKEADIAVTIEGGQVSSIVSDDPVLVGLNVLIIDCDTEGVEDDRPFKVPSITVTNETVGHCDMIELAEIDPEEKKQNIENPE